VFLIFDREAHQLISKDHGSLLTRLQPSPLLLPPS